MYYQFNTLSLFLLNFICSKLRGLEKLIRILTYRRSILEIFLIPRNICKIIILINLKSWNKTQLNQCDPLHDKKPSPSIHLTCNLFISSYTVILKDRWIFSCRARWSFTYSISSSSFNQNSQTNTIFVIQNSDNLSTGIHVCPFW